MNFKATALSHIPVCEFGSYADAIKAYHLLSFMSSNGLLVLPDLEVTTSFLDSVAKFYRINPAIFGEIIRSQGF